MGDAEKTAAVPAAAPDAAAAPPPEAKPDSSFWLVISKDETEAPPKCVRCENAASLTRAIEEHVLGSPTALHAFAFEGRRIKISSPRPVCSFVVDGEKVDVGRDSAEFDEGGRISPLAKPELSE